MFTSRPLRTTAAVAALVLSLAACGASQDESPTESSDGGGVEAAEPAQTTDDQAEDTTEESEDESASDETDEQESEEQESTEDEDAAEEDSEASAGQEADSLTITLNGEETDFTPEIVRCNGEPGTIRNVVITMKNDELPLVKVTPGEFAMVKVQQRGEPEKSSPTTDIVAEDGTVTFDSASIGDAVVDGSVTCLQGSQG